MCFCGFNTELFPFCCALGDHARLGLSFIHPVMRSVNIGETLCARHCARNSVTMKSEAVWSFFSMYGALFPNPV